MKFGDWVNDNPLRRWRASNGQSMVEVAAKLGVSVRAIQNWERGATPTDENMQRLVKLTGKARIAERWQEWLAIKLAS